MNLDILKQVKHLDVNKKRVEIKINKKRISEKLDMLSPKITNLIYMAVNDINDMNVIKKMPLWTGKLASEIHTKEKYYKNKRQVSKLTLTYGTNYAKLQDSKRFWFSDTNELRHTIDLSPLTTSKNRQEYNKEYHYARKHGKTKSGIPFVKFATTYYSHGFLDKFFKVLKRYLRTILNLEMDYIEYDKSF